MMRFVDRLLAASEAARSLVCVGLDVDPALMPAAVGRPAHGERAVVEFNRAIVDATRDLACAFKPNIAFYEALGMPGLRALEATIAHIREGCAALRNHRRLQAGRYWEYRGGLRDGDV